MPRNPAIIQGTPAYHVSDCDASDPVERRSAWVLQTCQVS